MADLEIIGPRGLTVDWGIPAKIQSEYANQTEDERPANTYTRRDSARSLQPVPAPRPPSARHAPPPQYSRTPRRPRRRAHRARRLRPSHATRHTIRGRRGTSPAAGALP